MMATSKKEPEATFTKGQLIRSKTYRDKQDALSALLDDNKEYSKREVDTILADFYGKE